MQIRTSILWLLVQALMAQLAVQSVAFVHGFAHSAPTDAFEIHASGHDPHARADAASHVHSFPNDCRHGSPDHAECGDDLIHSLAHVAHCCHLVGISSTLIEEDIVRVEATRFRAQVPRRASIVKPALFRPPIPA